MRRRVLSSQDNAGILPYIRAYAGSGGSGGVVAGQIDINLPNGLSSDVAVSGFSYVHVYGPTSAFSIDGFEAPTETPKGGRRFVLVNSTSQILTIVASYDSVSEETNKILTRYQNGVNIQLPPSAQCAFDYDQTAGMWAVEHIGLRMPFETNVRDFGATGDGVTDDTSAVQKAINTAAANGGGVVYVPAGQYVLTAPISLQHNVSIKGVSQQYSNFRVNHTGNGFQILDPINSSTSDFIYLEDIGVGCIASGSTGKGIYFQSGSYIGVNRCSVSGFSYGIYLFQTEVGFVRDCNASQCSVSEMYMSGSNGYLNNIDVHGNNFGGSSPCGLVLSGGVNVNVYSNNFTGHSRAGFNSYQINHLYNVGDIVAGGPYGFFYTCTVSGTSGGSSPNFPASGSFTWGGATFITGNVAGTAQFSGICSIYVAGLEAANIGPPSNYHEESTYYAAGIIFGEYSYESVLNGPGSPVGTSVSAVISGSYILAANPILLYGGYPTFDQGGPENLYLAGIAFEGPSGVPPVQGCGGVQTITAVGCQNFSGGPFFDGNTDTLTFLSYGNAGASTEDGIGLNVPNPTLDIHTRGRFANTFAGLSLVNGDNVDIVLTSTTQNITGPTGVFAIGGMIASADGQRVKLINLTTEQMTINHQDSSEATAANRIICPTGANVVLTTPSGGFSWAELVYSSNVSRWLLLGSG